MQSTDSNSVTTEDLRSISPIHCKMARAALSLGVRDLAKLAYVSPNTISRFERGEEVFDSTMFMIKSALENAGVDFIFENGGGDGVRLRKKTDV
ncbi:MULTISPECIES: helix-turn-helix transcriptional regulator [Roseobacteraceae]|uniref:Transcriptional regulator n=1 Tax=Pseudosulfitobacter pseudonitzschiae TaxID=1402135 RepID=A0A221K1H4_9RHOB|nr:MULTISPECIES: helix-turn-helix transcriptional regulator [Roseobacteraceae]ASM72835.1 transcriptional regulator [Pseudosulfitobacter pseudonitzschiae]